VSDTVQLRRDPEWFPFLTGLSWTYHHTSTAFEGVETVRIELLEILHGPDGETARAALWRSRMGATPSRIDYSIHKTGKELRAENGVLGASRREFSLPASVGTRWSEPPDDFKIASIDETIQVPAGRFTGCLRVNAFLAGGDAGSSIRYYAPNLGYVYEEYSGETRGARVSLVSFSREKK
jgi:hypothetical protein